MPRDTLLLVRRTTDRPSVAATHARRLRSRDVVDDVRVATYEQEPVRELRDELRALDADRAFAVPLCLAHSRETLDAVPAALSAVDAPVHYCEPVGRNPAVTRTIRDRATDHYRAGDDVSLVLVGFGASGTPYHRQAVEYHAARLRGESGFGEVVPCYLLQNPAVECVRYNVANERAVAVPLFVQPSSATDEEIPAKLGVDRGGVAYADPLGEHPLVTDAIEASVASQRVVAGDARDPHSFEATLTARARALATDGEGEPL